MTNRQEVAEKLRESGKWLDSGDTASIREALFLIDQNVEAPNCREFAPLFDRIADLVDPTCHVTDEEVTHEPTLNALAVHAYECDKCGWYFYMAEVCCHPKPFYCPMCGARVVQDEA